MDRLPLDDELALLFAAALIAIARADRELTIVEGLRVRELVAARTGHAFGDEELFFTDVSPARLAAAMGVDASGPFRTSAPVSAQRLGRALVEDGIEVTLADGDLTPAEAQLLVRFARALGCGDALITAHAPRLRWFLAGH